jgi:hypothetical protein
MTTYIRRLLNGTMALRAPVEDAGAAAVAAEAAAPPPVDPAAAADHEGDDAAEAAGATREADDREARGEPAEPEKPARIPWQNKRIDKLTAEAKAQQERADRLEREAQEARDRVASYEALYGKPDGAAPAPAGGPRTYTELELQAEAARIANVNRLNERIEGVFDAGVKAKGTEWNARVQQAAQAFGADLQKRPDFFEALTALPNPEAIYFELAGDLDHFAEVLAMPPVKMGMELASIAHRASSPRPPNVSRAPAPITPLDGQAPEDIAMDKLPMDDYVRVREKQMAERQASRR